MAVENLIISIKAEDMASNVIKGVAQSIRTLANDLLYTASIQIADGIMEATKALGSFQMELELTDIAFTQMIKGADRGRASLEEYTDVARALRNELHDLAAETPFSFQDVNRGARQLMAYGFGVKEIEPMLRTIGDAAAAFGGSPVAIYRTIRALGQIKAYGRLKGQELLQLTEVGIPAHEILRDELKLNSEQLSRIADQHIPAQEAIEALLRGIEKRYAGMMEVQSRTMQGSIAAIKDNLMLVGTQLTHSLYNEVRDEVRSFRLSLDEYKNMTRVAGWRGLFGQAKYYEKNGKEIDTSKMNQQEYDNLRARLEKGEVRRVFDTTHYTDTEGRLVNTATMSPQELSFRELKGDITQKDSLIPSAWQESLFKLGDYFLMLLDNIKSLGSAFIKLWQDIGGNHILVAVGFEIFQMINGFIILATSVLEVADDFVVFIDKITQFGAVASVVESAIIGIGAALMMTAAVNVTQNFLMFINTFRIMIGYAGIVGVQFGILVGAVHLFGMASDDAAVGVGAVGAALMIYINRAQIAAAVTLALAGVMRVVNSVVAIARAVWTALITTYVTIKTTILGVITVFNAFSASLVVGNTLAMALRNSVLLLNMVFGGSRLAQIAMTAATVACTLVTEGLIAVYTATVAVVEGAIAAFHILRGTYVAAGGAAAIFSLTIQGATLATEVFSGAITVLSALMTAFRAKVLLIVAVVGTVIAVLYNLSEGFANLVDRIANAILDMITRVINFVLSVVGEFVKEIGQMFFGGFEWIGGNLSEMWHSIFSNLLDTVKDFVVKVLKQLGPIGELILEIGEKLDNAWEKFKNGQGTPLERLKKLIYNTDDFDPGGGLNLDQFTKNYTTPIPQNTGAGNKKSKEEKLQPWEKEVSLGEYFAHMSTTLDAVGKSVDDLLPKFFAASNSFKHLSGDVDEFVKYAETLSGNGINKSIVYDAKDTNHLPQYGEVVVYTGEDGKRHTGIYMGDGKVRTGVDEVVATWKQITQSVNTGNNWSEGLNVKGNTMRIDLQGRGECTIKSAEAMIRAHDNVDMELGFGGANWWWEAMESRFQSVDIQSVDDFVNRVTEHFDKFPDSPMSMWVTGGYGGHATNPNESHAVVIARKTEDGKYVVYDPADASAKYFNNPAEIIDPTFGTNLNGYYGLQGLDTGARIWWRDQSPGITNWENEGLKNYGIGGKQQGMLSIPSDYRAWLDNLMPYRLPDDIIDYTIKTAKEFNVDPTQVFAQMWVESKGQHELYSPVGAYGRMQLMPEAAEQVGVNRYDEYENILGGIKYIKWLQDNFFGDDIKKVVQAYNGGPGAVLEANGKDTLLDPETVTYWILTQSKMSTAPELGDIGEVTQSVVNISKQVAEVNKEALKNISDLNNVQFVDINATGEKGRIKIEDQTKEQKKALDELYKKQNQINNAVKEYNTYMGASQLKLDEINGNFTEYREKVLETRAEFAKTVEQAQKLVGQGLSRSDADKMVARAREVAEAIMKEFERVRKIKFEIDFKSNQAKIAELNHNIEKSLILQKESETLQLDNDAFEAGKQILRDASAIPEIMAEYAKVRNTGKTFGEFMQDLLSVDAPFTETNSKFAEFIKTNEGLWEYWVTLVDAKSQELKQKFDLAGKTLFSQTTSSYANQGDLQGLMDYLQSPEGEQQRTLEQSFAIQQEWCNRLIEMYRYVGQEAQQAMLTLHDSIIDHGTSAIMDFIKGTKSAKEAFKDFALSVMEDVVKMVLKMAMMEAVSGIFGGMFGGGKSSGGFGTGLMWGNIGFAEGGAVKKGQTVLVGEKGPELLSLTNSESALDSPKSRVVGERGPEVITIPYTGYIIPNDDLLKMAGYYSDDKDIMSYMISGFRAEGGKVEKDKAYIVGEKGPEVFSPGSGGNIFSNEQLHSTLTNLDRISRSGSMESPNDKSPQQTIPPVVVNLDNKSGTQMTAQAESNFDGDQWVVSVVLDAVNRNVGGLRNVIGNVSGRR